MHILYKDKFTMCIWLNSVKNKITFLQLFNTNNTLNKSLNYRYYLNQLFQINEKWE